MPAQTREDSRSVSPREGGLSNTRTARNEQGELPKTQPPFRVAGKPSNNPNPPREQRDVER